MSAVGSTAALPSIVGRQYGGSYNNTAATPRRNLQAFITPLDEQGRPNPRYGSFIRLGASTIARRAGCTHDRFVKFSVRGRDLAGGLLARPRRRSAAWSRHRIAPEWAGEFQEMEEAEARLMIIIPISIILVCILLYLAFRSFLDAAVVLSSVLELSLGGVWALVLTGNNFSISAAVGFVSMFGVAIMDGLLLISYFNHLRAEGLPLREAILTGAEKRVRPVMMTALTAIFGLAVACGHVHAYWLAGATWPLDHRRRRWHDRDAVHYPLPDAGAVHLLRRSRTAQGIGQHGALSQAIRTGTARGTPRW